MLQADILYLKSMLKDAKLGDGGVTTAAEDGQETAVDAAAAGADDPATESESPESTEATDATDDVSDRTIGSVPVVDFGSKDTVRANSRNLKMMRDEIGVLTTKIAMLTESFAWTRKDNDARTNMQHAKDAEHEKTLQIELETLKRDCQIVGLTSTATANETAKVRNTCCRARKPCVC